LHLVHRLQYPRIFGAWFSYQGPLASWVEHIKHPWSVKGFILVDPGMFHFGMYPSPQARFSHPSCKNRTGKSGGHGVQTELPHPSATNIPVQYWQTSIDVAPSTVEYFPGAQPVQPLTVPLTEEYVPGLHGAHDGAPTDEYFPATQ
jgi:hypothetical protein